MTVIKKFILEDNFMIVSKCRYHAELASDETLVKGGGMYKVDVFKDKTKKPIITLFGESYKFKGASIENIQKAISLGKVYSDKDRKNNISSKYIFTFNKRGTVIKFEKYVKLPN